MRTINFPENLRRLREQRNLSKSELARRIGVSDVTVGYWETGKAEPRMGKVEMIASILGVTTDDLIFIDDCSDKIESCSILYGSGRKIDIPQNVSNKYPRSFLIKVEDDSLNKVVNSGCYALIDPVEIFNGDIVAVLYNNKPILRRYYKLQNSVALEPDSFDSSHQTIVLGNTEKFEVMGKMVWFMSMIEGVD